MALLTQARYGKRGWGESWGAVMGFQAFPPPVLGSKSEG